MPAISRSSLPATFSHRDRVLARKQRSERKQRGIADVPPGVMMEPNRSSFSNMNCRQDLLVLY